MSDTELKVLRYVCGGGGRVGRWGGGGEGGGWVGSGEGGKEVGRVARKAERAGKW